jgi:hypothetical protein
MTHSTLQVYDVMLITFSGIFNPLNREIVITRRDQVGK